MAHQKHPKSQAGPDQTLEKLKTGHVWRDTIRATILLFLSATCSRLSSLALAPVYGSTPVHIYHDALCALAILAGYSLETLAPGSLSQKDKLLPGAALSTPIVQRFLFQRSSLFGNPAGPALTEMMTIFPLLLLSVATYLKLVDTVHFRQINPTIGKVIPIVGGFALFKLADTTVQSMIPLYIGSNVLIPTFGLQVVTASLYAILFPSPLSLILFSLPASYLFLATKAHMPFALSAKQLNSTLHGVNYSLVARQESLTGYISVLDNTELGFRAMRCDHSLLGGEWTRRPSNYNPRASDPIYAVFTMLEAVRLVEPDPGLTRREDKDTNSLVIGLGIGTTPAALIQHGIETTVVEIDPVVYKFALQHFNFPRNHTAIIDNAVTFVETARQESKQFDYIIHDVFTGGVEPVELFTWEFMQGLNALLKDDGIVAINYAGDLSLPAAGLVVRTIRWVFPECRIFRENDGSDESAEEPLDFTNMVIFCKKTRGTPLSFRPPNENDYLGSQLREAYMYPRREIDPRLFDMVNDPTGQQILEVGKTSILESYHTQSAIGHWNIMRNVLPAKVWENF